MEKLTPKQAEVLIFIKKFMISHGFPPTVREIGKGMNVSSPATTQAHLNNLEAKGYIKKNNSKNRALELRVVNEFKENSEDVVKVPLLGKITAGSPIEAISNPNEYFDLPSYLVPKNKEVFTLQVNGDSMINIGIYDNDTVIVQKQNTANNGDVIVAMTEDNEVTLKTFYKENDHIRLQPENNYMKPILLNNITVLGKAIGLYRKF
jgi:repressor LexA